MSQTHAILAATQAFNSNLHKLAQQTQSKLAPHVRIENLTTRSEFFDRVGKIRMQEVTSRHQDTPFTPVPFSRRRLDIRDFVVSDLIDDADVAKALVNAQAATVASFVEASNIQQDILIARALLSKSVATDENFSVTDVALPATQKIAHGSTNLTTAKIKDAQDILGSNDVDFGNGKVTLAINFKGFRSLLDENEFINKDFRLHDNREILQTELSNFLGINIVIVSNEVIAVNGNIRSGILFTNDSLILGINKRITVESAKNPQKNMDLSVVGKSSMGAVRMEEEKVVQIDYDETAE